MKKLLGLALLVSAAASGSTSFVFETVPGDGFLQGPPGALLGFGYVLENPDPTLYLLTTNFTADSFANATVTSLFDFPILAPGQSITVPFDSGALQGLYAILLDAGAPVGFITNGAFTISADFYDGDPLNGGSFVSSADDQVAGFSVTVTSSVPEPGLWWGTGVALLGMSLRARKIRARD